MRTFKYLSLLAGAASLSLGLAAPASAASVPLSIGSSCIAPGFASAVSPGSTASFEISDPAGCFGNQTDIAWSVTSTDLDATVDVTVGLFSGTTLTDTLASATLGLTGGLLEFSFADTLIAELIGQSWGIIFDAAQTNTASLNAGGTVFFIDSGNPGGGVVIGGGSPSEVPLPASALLLLGGLGGFAALRRAKA